MDLTQSSHRGKKMEPVSSLVTKLEGKTRKTLCPCYDLYNGRDGRCIRIRGVPVDLPQHLQSV